MHAAHPRLGDLLTADAWLQVGGKDVFEEAYRVGVLDCRRSFQGLLREVRVSRPGLEPGT